MKRVLTAVVLIPLVVLALFRAPLWLFTLLVLLVAMQAAREYLDIAQAAEFRPFRLTSYIAVIWIFAALLATVGKLEGMWLFQILLVVLLVPLVLFAMVLLSMSMDRESLAHSLPDSAVSFFLLPYIAIPLALLVQLRMWSGSGALFLFGVMLMVWAGDIAAYYTGRSIGKHKLAPRISPGKTWEGTFGSVAGSLIVGVLFFRFCLPLEQLLAKLHLYGTPGFIFGGPLEHGTIFQMYAGPMWLVVVLAIAVNVSGQLGDLAESALKRGAGVKDSGTLLPGHGGVLDRIDALLFAIPVAWMFFAAGMGTYFRYIGE